MERRLEGLPELSTRGQTCSITTQGPTRADPGGQVITKHILNPRREAVHVSKVMAGLSNPLKVQLQSSSLFQQRSKYHRLKWLLQEPQPPSFHPLWGVNKGVWGSGQAL